MSSYGLPRDLDRLVETVQAMKGAAEKWAQVRELTSMVRTLTTVVIHDAIARHARAFCRDRWTRESPTARNIKTGLHSYKNNPTTVGRVRTTEKANRRVVRGYGSSKQTMMTCTSMAISWQKNNTHNCILSEISLIIESHVLSANLGTCDGRKSPELPRRGQDG